MQHSSYNKSIIPKGIEPRLYRENMGRKRFKSFAIGYKDSDLWIGIDPLSFEERMKQFAQQKLVELRTSLEKYIEIHPEFANSFVPIKLLPEAPPIAITMHNAAKTAHIGPMAAVAGAFSEFIGKALQQEFIINEIAIENGGDIYVSVKENITISVYAGESLLSNKVGIEVLAAETPLGICTSAGTVGPSVSMGNADAVVVACKNTALADAFATAIGNNVLSGNEIENALQITESQCEILSLFIICEQKLGIKGKFNFKLMS